MGNWDRFEVNIHHIWPFLILFTVLALCCGGGGSVGAAFHPLLGVFGGVAGLVTALVVALIFTTVFVVSTKIDKGRNHIVLKRGEIYKDYGPGSMYLGVSKWWYQVFDYDPTQRMVTNTVQLQAKDGTFLTADMTYSWKPDPENLDEFFSHNHEKRMNVFFALGLQDWAKHLYPAEIFQGKVPRMQSYLDAANVTLGVTFGGPMLGNIRTEDGDDLSGYLRDNMPLIKSIVDEIAEESLIDQISLQLKKIYPGRDQHIDRLCGQRKAEIRRRGLRT